MNNRQYLESQPDAELLMQMLGLIPDETPHAGRATDYAKRVCSCQACYEAFKEKQRSWCPPHKTPHGTVTGYQNYRCRCGLCRRAWADRKAARKKARTAA